MSTTEIQTFEKRDVIEMIEEDGVELIRVESDPVYYKALCPLHDERNPSFIVYPHIQRWTCHACQPGYHDVIDFFQLRYGWSFPKAKDHATTPISDEEGLLRYLKDHEFEDAPDLIHLTTRMHALTDLIPFPEAQGIFRRVDALLKESRWIEVDRVLRRAGA